jgi:uncharacterized repeat protein (TIGR01451 family)
MKNVLLSILIGFSFLGYSQNWEQNVSILEDFWNSEALDFDGDGDLDILYMSGVYMYDTNESYLYALENDGSNNFSRLVLLSRFENPFSFHYFKTADFNVDGLPDLLVNSDSGVEILKNLGDFNLETAYTGYQNTIASEYYSSPNSSFIADFDSDGFNDLLQVKSDIFIWYKGTDQPFNYTEQPAIELPLTECGFLLLNNDEIPDIIGRGEDYMQYQTLGVGDGTFSNELINSYFDSWCLNCVDLNNDGFLDKVSFETTNIQVLLTNEDFSYEYIAINTSYQFYGSVGDYNGDSFVDILAVGAGQYTLALNQGDNSFQSSSYTSSEYGMNQPKISEDFNQDGYDDIWCWGEAHQLVFGAQDFDLENLYIEDMLYPKLYLHDYAMFKYDDHKVIASGGPEGLCSLLIDDNGIVNESTVFFEFEETNCNIMGTADLDNDDDLDIVVDLISTDFLNHEIKIAEILDDGSHIIHSIPNVAGYYDSYSTYRFDPVLSDIDGDGLVDIFSTDYYEIGYYKNLGGFQFIYTTIGGLYPLNIGDLENDGDIDFFGYCDPMNETFVCALVNDGQGNFTEIPYAFEYAFDFIDYSLLKDVNNDNLADMVVNSSDVMALYLNDGSQSFNLEYEYYNDVQFQSVPSTNFIEDHYVSLECTDGLGLRAVDVLTGEILNTISAYPATSTTVAKFMDVDGDGDDDVLFDYLYDSKRIYCLKNYMVSAFNASGSVYIDSNANGVLDESEITVDIGNLSVSGDYQFINQNTDGTFQVHNNSGEFTCTLLIDENVWSFSTASSFTVNLTADNPLYEFNFGLVPVGIVQSVSCDFVLSNNLCNQQNVAVVTIENDGNTIVEAGLAVQLDPLFQFISSDPVPTFNFNNVLNFDDSTIAIGEVMIVTIQLQNPDESFLGNLFQFNVASTIIISDIPVETDYCSWSAIVQCAYDPNDKQELTTLVNEGLFESGAVLEYLVRFQNTGNAPATNVRIDDQLSSSLDWTSLEILSASHPYSVSMTSDGLASFHFDNINLPDSFSNEAASHGFIKYAIRTLDTMNEGDGVYNTAYIYFDDNPAVITNTTQNYLVTGMVEFGSEQDQLHVFPNPFDDRFTVQFNSKHSHVTIRVFDITGHVVLEERAYNPDMNFEINGSSSVYLLQISDEHGRVIGSTRIMKQ